MATAISEMSRAGIRTQLGRRQVFRRHRFAFPLLLGIALLIANLIVQPSFNWTDEFAAMAPIAIAAMASTPQIVSGGGGIDVSISPVMTFANILFVTWLVPAGLGGAAAVPILLAIGAAIGALSAIIISALRLPPIVVTLCGYFIITGVNLKILPNPVRLGPSWVDHLGGSVGPVPGGLVALLIPLAMWIALMALPYGRLLYSVGGNDAAAFSAGVNIAAVRIVAFAVGGAFAAVGGLVLAGIVSSADSSTSTAYTLVAITAVALGGIGLEGGRGGMTCALVGAACIFLLQTLLTSLQIQSAWLQVVYGVVLMLAVIFMSLTSSTKEAT